MMKFSDIRRAYNKRFILTTRNRLSLYTKIRTFAAGGLALEKILTTIGSEYRKRKNAKHEIIEDWLGAMGEGKSFHETIAPWVPATELSLIKAGEEAGELVKGLDNAIMTTETMRQIRGSIVGALAYPTALVVFALVLAYIFSFKAIPAMVSLLPPEKWPAASKMLYSFSMFIRYDWYYGLAGIATALVFVFGSLPRMTGRLRTVLDKVPPYSTYRSIQSSAFLIAVASMMGSGTPIVEAVHNVRDTSNRYVRSHIDRIARNLESKRAGEALDVNFFDTELRIDIVTYATSADIEDHLERIGQTAIKETMASIKASLAVASSGALLLIGGYAMWLYYTFFVLNQAVTRHATMP